MQLVKNCAQSVLNEFKLYKFAFQHNQIKEFYKSQWQSKDCSAYYLIYRWIWALFFIVIFTTSLVLQFSEGKFFIFLTNWGIILCMLTQLTAAILVTQWHFNICDLRTAIDKLDHRVGIRTPLTLKLYWLLHDVTLSLALIITTVYWIFLHGKMDKPMRFPVMSFVTHCLNSVFMLVDFLIVAFPVRILHTVYNMLLPITFCLFTVVYFHCGGHDEYGNHYVYPILDWTKPIRGITTFAGVFGLYIVYAFILFFIYKLKKYIHRTVATMTNPQTVGLV